MYPYPYPYPYPYYYYYYFMINITGLVHVTAIIQSNHQTEVRCKLFGMYLQICFIADALLAKHTDKGTAAFYLHADLLNDEDYVKG